MFVAEVIRTLVLTGLCYAFREQLKCLLEFVVIWVDQFCIELVSRALERRSGLQIEDVTMVFYRILSHKSLRS